MYMDIKEVRKKNLKKLIDNNFKGSVHAFAKNVKRPSGFFYDVFAGRRPLGERIMRAIESSLGLMPYELDTPETDFKEKRFELVNVYDLKVSITSDNKCTLTQLIDETPVSTTLIRKYGWEQRQLCSFHINGNSMEPTLPHGSKVLIKCLDGTSVNSQKSAHELLSNINLDALEEGKIYAISRGEEVYLKRLYKVFNENKLIAKSDNPIYPDLYIDLSDSNFRIIGEAVFRLEELIA